MSIASSSSLVSGLIPERNIHGLTRDIGLILIGSCLLALSSQFKVPVGPVPITPAGPSPSEHLDLGDVVLAAQVHLDP